MKSKINQPPVTVDDAPPYIPLKPVRAREKALEAYAEWQAKKDAAADRKKVMLIHGLGNFQLSYGLGGYGYRKLPDKVWKIGFTRDDIIDVCRGEIKVTVLRRALGAMQREFMKRSGMKRGSVTSRLVAAGILRPWGKTKR